MPSPIRKKKMGFPLAFAKPAPSEHDPSAHTAVHFSTQTSNKLATALSPSDTGACPEPSKEKISTLQKLQTDLPQPAEHSHHMTAKEPTSGASSETDRDAPRFTQTEDFRCKRGWLERHEGAPFRKAAFQEFIKSKKGVDSGTAYCSISDYTFLVHPL